MIDKHDGAKAVPVRRFAGAAEDDDLDPIAVEEPMEIRVVHGPETDRSSRSVSITMRTPGHDFELAVGFLFTEGILSHPDEARQVAFCGPPAPGRPTSNIVKVEVAPEVELDLGRLQRHFFTSSSCGICGKASLEALEVQGLRPIRDDHLSLDASVVRALPEIVRASQPVFERTGGLHAAALVTGDGGELEVREDVGRHNAVDKVLGRAFLDGRTPLQDRALLVSGRASFEILQKALVAGVPMLIAVGAPSSLAVEMAERYGMTLVGFASSDRFNVYTGRHRILSR